MSLHDAAGKDMSLRDAAGLSLDELGLEDLMQVVLRQQTLGVAAETEIRQTLLKHLDLSTIDLTNGLDPADRLTAAILMAKIIKAMVSNLIPGLATKARACYKSGDHIQGVIYELAMVYKGDSDMINWVFKSSGLEDIDEILPEEIHGDLEGTEHTVRLFNAWLRFRTKSS